jgi:hypothetical protein
MKAIGIYARPREDAAGTSRSSPPATARPEPRPAALNKADDRRAARPILSRRLGVILAPRERVDKPKEISILPSPSRYSPRRRAAPLPSGPKSAPLTGTHHPPMRAWRSCRSGERRAVPAAHPSMIDCARSGLRTQIHAAGFKPNSQIQTAADTSCRYPPIYARNRNCL